MPYRVLLVEDEAGIRVGLEDSFRVAGYEVEAVADGEAALQVASQGGCDVIVLDLILPVMDGITVCQELRAKGVDTPVLMLTAKAQLEERLRGFAVGADDYLTKPFEVLELLARIRAILRRTHPARRDGNSQALSFGEMRVNTKQAAVWRGSERLRLSMREYDLLHYFVTHPGETLSRQRLLKRVWKYQKQTPTRTVDVHVGWLRRKIEKEPANPRWIRTVYGKGYEFVPD